MRRMGVAMPAAALLALVGCASSGDSAATAEGTLDERLGGKGAITAVADDFDGSEAAFGAFVEDLVRSLDKFKVPAREQGELVATLGGMEGRIAGR